MKTVLELLLASGSLAVSTEDHAVGDGVNDALWVKSLGDINVEQLGAAVDKLGANGRDEGLVFVDGSSVDAELVSDLDRLADGLREGE